MKKAIILLILIQFSNVVRGQEKKDFSLSFNHIALSVKDVNVSAQFYTNVLDLEIIPLPPEAENVKWISLGDGKELHLVSIFKDEIKTNKAIHLALSTASFDEFVLKLKEMKVEYSDFPGNLNKINTRPDGIKQVFFQDPDGYWIEVNSSKQPAGNNTGEIAGNYRVLKDISYGPDANQNLDIYLSGNAKPYGKQNYTIVFLHGGAYYGSDKSLEERYIEPYLNKGYTVVNMNYRLKRGIPIATSDLTKALNYLKVNNDKYDLKLSHIIVTGFSAGAQIATNVALAQNNREFPDTLEDDIEIIGVINFSGPVDDLEAIERIFIDHEDELFTEVGKLLFPSGGYTGKEALSVYEPITYFDENDPPVFLWHGGLDDQIPAVTFENFVSSMRKNKDVVMFVKNGKHSPSEEELATAYEKIFMFLDDLPDN